MDIQQDLEEDVQDDSETLIDDSLLVESVAQYPALYNIKLADYHNGLIKERCWEMIAETMNHPVAKCMARWLRLKDNFRREKNKRDKESRSGQGLSYRRGFSLYDSMAFMHAHMIKRKTFTNTKSSEVHAATKRTKLSNHLVFQSTGSATWQTQNQCMLPVNPSPTSTITSSSQEPLFTLPQDVESSQLSASCDPVPLTTTLTYPNTRAPVWMPTTMAPTLFSTVSKSPATISKPPVIIDTTATTEPVQMWPLVNVPLPDTSPAVTFTTSAAATETTISEPTFTEPAITPTTPTLATESAIPSTTKAAAVLSAMYRPPITPSPPVRTRTPLARISTPNIRAPQSSPNTTPSPSSFHSASPGLSSASSPASPSPADSLYSSIYSDFSCDFNSDDANTVHTRISHVGPQRESSFLKSPSHSLLSTTVTRGYSAQNINNTNSATPKACYNKDMARQKKIDPLEASMISLSNSIKDRLQAEPAPKQTVLKTPDQVFGEMVAAELSHMSDADKANIKTLIVDILFARSK